MLRSSWSQGTCGLPGVAVCGWAADEVKREMGHPCALSWCPLISLYTWYGFVAVLHHFLADTQLPWVAGPVSLTSGQDSLTLLFMQLLHSGPVDAVAFYVIAVSLLTRGSETRTSSRCHFQSTKSCSEGRGAIGTTPGSPFPSGPELVAVLSGHNPPGRMDSQPPALPSVRREKHKTQKFESQPNGG